VIDIMAVGVAVQRGGTTPAPEGAEAAADDEALALPGTPLESTPARAAPAGAQRAGLGIRAATPLARLTSHSR